MYIPITIGKDAKNEKSQNIPQTPCLSPTSVIAQRGIQTDAIRNFTTILSSKNFSNDFMG